jgi:hypothetical protein
VSRKKIRKCKSLKDVMMNNEKCGARSVHALAEEHVRLVAIYIMDEGAPKILVVFPLCRAQFPMNICRDFVVFRIVILEMVVLVVSLMNWWIRWSEQGVDGNMRALGTEMGWLVMMIGAIHAVGRRLPILWWSKIRWLRESSL